MTEFSFFGVNYPFKVWTNNWKSFSANESWRFSFKQVSIALFHCLTGIPASNSHYWASVAMSDLMIKTAMLKAPQCLHFLRKWTNKWPTYNIVGSSWARRNFLKIDEMTFRREHSEVPGQPQNFGFVLAQPFPVLFFIDLPLQACAVSLPLSASLFLSVMHCSSLEVFVHSYGINQMKGRRWACRVVTSSEEYCSSDWINGKWNGIWSHKVLRLETRPMRLDLHTQLSDSARCFLSRQVLHFAQTLSHCSFYRRL